MAGPAAHFQRRPRMHGLLRLRPPPHGLCTLSLPEAGAWGSDLFSTSVFWVLSPSSNNNVFSVQNPFGFFIVEMLYGFLPAQQSFLGFSNSLWTCPVQPPGPVHCPLSRTTRARWCGAPGLGPPHHQPPGHTSAPLGFLLKQPLLLTPHALLCLRLWQWLLVFLYSLLGWGQPQRHS